MRIRKTSRALASVVLTALLLVQVYPVALFAEDIVPPTDVTPIADFVIAPSTTPDAPIVPNDPDLVAPEVTESTLEVSETIESVDEISAMEDILSDDLIQDESHIFEDSQENIDEGSVLTPEDVEAEEILHNLATTTVLVTATSTDETIEEFALGGSATTSATSTIEIVGDVIGGVEVGEGGEDAKAASSTPSIVSGKAVAMANILNIVNTNLINSTGNVVFLNLLENVENAIDFRDYFNTADGGVCDLLSCGANDGVQVNLLNDAYIENQIKLHATSGENEIVGGDSAEIQTGDAYAGLNLVNVANTNFVDSNYLLVTLNAFDGVSGDIVFPNLQKFFTSLKGTSNSAFSMNLSNHADILNEVETGAESGNNKAEGGQMMTINTGSSKSSSNVFNQINTNLSEDSKISILFRVHGNWLGEIYGAPLDLLHTQGLNGDFYLTNAPSPESGLSNALGSVNATSTAGILNDVSVTALTGNNEITGADTALISTGNAFAGANLVNIANANVIGRNWIFAIINIFGDFEGNIAFGRPDLWVGEQIEVPSSVQDGTVLTYKFTVINNGDSPATEVNLIDAYDANHLDILESSYDYVVDDNGNLVWSIGILPSGGATEISYQARIKNAGYGTDITNVVKVVLRETDNNTLDNSDTATIRTDPAPSGGGWYYYPPVQTLEEVVSSINTEGDLKFTVERVTASSTVTNASSRSVLQKITLKNPENRDVSNVVLHDILKDPEGNILQAEYFDLGTVLANEEINIEYEVMFGESALPGEYALFTVVNAGSRHLSFASNGSVDFLMDMLRVNLLTEVAPVVSIATSSLSLVGGLQETIGASFTEDREVGIVKEFQLNENNAVKASLTDFVGVRTAHADQSDLSASVMESGVTTRDVLQVILLILVVALSLAGLNKIRIILSRA